MTTILNASNGATSGLIATGDNSGVLQLQVNNGTPALTLNTTQALGVGSSPSYGTSGQVLTSGGTSASPTWTTPSSGAMSLISTQTASSSSSLTWTGLSGYKSYFLMIDGLIVSDSSAFYVQIGTGSTPTWITSYYLWSSYNTSYSGPGNSYNTSDSGYDLAAGNGSQASKFSGQVYLHNLLSSTAQKSFLSHMIFNGGAATAPITAGEWYGGTTTCTAVRLIPATGTITSGTASLYGISS